MVASAQVTLLALTQRKSACELDLSIDAIDKAALTREQSALSKEYYSKLQAKKVSYYANGQYHKMNYTYLMGTPATTAAALIAGDDSNLKTDRNMILTDYKGQVVLSENYAQIITSVLGAGAMDANGCGSTFSTDKIPEMLAKLGIKYTADEYRTAMAGKDLDDYNYGQSTNSTLTGETKSKSEGTANQTNNINKIIDFYLPIFKAAAVNGWTSEYNKEWASNDDYISDAIITGTFQLESVNEYGEYDEGTTLTYFVTSGAIQTRTDSDTREEITAWYNAEKERIAEKENYIDIHMSDLSTELEAIKTEIQSIQSFIDDGIQSVFNWGSG